MKTLIKLIFLTLSIFIFSQAPEKMSFQAIIRNLSNEPVASQTIGLRISVLQDSPTGTVVYQETYSPNPTTNAFGLVTLQIGSGNPEIGTFSAIDWSKSTYYIQTEADLTGGNSYTLTSTAQLLSVPYALFAKTSANVPNTWLTSGNSNVNGYYLGTNDSSALNFRTNSTERMKLTDTGLEMQNEIKPNGIAGQNGQVLQSNGNGTMAWKNAAYGNNVRFMLNFYQNSVSRTVNWSILPYYSAEYNLNPTEVELSGNKFIFHKSGLYHFDIIVDDNIVTSINPSVFPTGYYRMVFTGAPQNVTIPIKIGVPISRGSTNVSWYLNGSQTFDAYISSGQTMELNFRNEDNNISYSNLSIQVIGNLISE